MNKTLQADLASIENLLERVKNQGVDYLSTLDKRATCSTPVSQIDNQLNQQALGAEQALKLFNQKFEKTIVASSGPRYWGFVTGGSTPASILGDWLATVYDQNTQTGNGQGDISASIEFETINLLLDLFDLPQDFLGGFVTGATMSNFTCLAVARQWLGKQLNQDFAKDGITKKINILSATPHSSSIKSLSMLGIGSNNCIVVKTESGKRESISISDLEENIKQLNGEPFILISSAGTVNLVDFDDFSAIRKLKEKYNFWWHIDAAFGGFAACSDEHKHLVKDWEYADSITIDCHKWLNVPYESAVFFVKQEHKMQQIETFQNTNAPYLGDPLENFNYLNFLPENSRRLRALPAWFSLKAYGKDGYKDIVENSVNLARSLGDKITNSTQFELIAPIILNNICFTLTGDDSQNKVDRFLKALNTTGKLFMSPTVYNNQKGIRASFVNWQTTQDDIELVFKEMLKLV